MTTGHKSQLVVFISSKMTELRDLREIVAHELDKRGINAWVYERDAGSRPDSVEETSLAEVEAADVYVGIFAEKYGAVTVQEFEHARALGKPCFVYVRDRHAAREPELSAFLDRDVYPLKSGVTYAFFDGAVDLGRQMAEDVMSWLVGHHRETTARLKEAEASQAEKERLASELERLKTFSATPLPSGTSVDLLAHQLRGWLGTLGYGVERGEMRENQYFEWVISVPARRGYERVVVRGIEGEAQIPDLQALSASVGQHRADEGWLLAARRISPAARQEAESTHNGKIFCYTLDTLIDEHADFEGYFRWLDSEVKKRGINELYIPLSAKKEEFLPKTDRPAGSSSYGAKEGYLDGYIDRWLDDPSKEHVSILGEFGTGKTWFAIHYAWVAMNQYLDAKARGVERPRIPLYVPLRDYAKAISVESLFSEFFFRKYEIPLPGYSAFQQLNRMGKLLLIFDGFDEMAAKIDRQAMIDNFWELARVVVPGSKVILTSRTEHFPTSQESRLLLRAELTASTSALTGVPPQFEVLELEKMSNDQVERMLRLRASEPVVKLILDNAQLLDLARRPVMTDLIMEAIPDIEAGKKLDISRVYLYAVQRKMARDISDERTFTSMADKLFFLCELSWEMLSTDQMTINYRVFPDRIRQLFGKTVKEEKDVDHWRYDMMGQTMLIRSAEGDYTPAHRSLLEFFVAYKFVAELGLLAPDFLPLAGAQSNVDTSLPPREYRWSEYFQRERAPAGVAATIPPLQAFLAEPLEKLRQTVGQLQPFTRAVVDLMRGMVEPDEAKARERVFFVLDNARGKGEPAVGFTAANLLTALPFPHRRKLLAGGDLSDLYLHSALLSHAGLHACDLRRSVLTHADLTGADLSDANVDETDFTDAEITERGWLTELGLPGGDVLSFSYGSRGRSSGKRRGKRPKWGEIIISRSTSGSIKWVVTLKGRKISADQVDEGRSTLSLLLIDGAAHVIDLDSGKTCSAEPSESVFRWKNTDARRSIGLSPKECHLIRISGGQASDLPYDIDSDLEDIFS